MLKIDTVKLDFFRGLQAGGKISSTGGSRSSTISTKGNHQTQEDIQLVKKNFKVLQSLFGIKIARGLEIVSSDLLAHSQPRVPYDSGQLRESGKVTMSANKGSEIVTATGNKEGTIVANLGMFKASNLINTTRIEATVSYQRVNEKGEDIAQWTHEVLRPQEERTTKEKGSGISYAKQIGTGPKYLQIPFLERRAKYESFAKNILNPTELERDIALISETHKASTGTYPVNKVKLVQSKVDKIGYFGNANFG